MRPDTTEMQACKRSSSAPMRGQPGAKIKAAVPMRKEEGTKRCTDPTKTKDKGDEAPRVVIRSEPSYVRASDRMT